MEGRVRRWSNPNEPINRLFASTMAGGKIGVAARSGEGCANIVSSFLHYVDWIWTGYRGFSTRGLLSFQAAPEFSTRHNSRPSLPCTCMHAPNPSIPLVHRPPAPASGSIHFDLCIHTFIFMPVAATFMRAVFTIERHRSTSTLQGHGVNVHGSREGAEAWVQLDVFVPATWMCTAPRLMGCHVSTMGEGVLGVLDRVNGSTNCFIRTLSCVELSLDNVGMSLVLEEMIRGIMWLLSTLLACFVFFFHLSWGFKVIW